MTVAKGYWIACSDVSNWDGYRAYIETNFVTFAKFPSRLLIRGGAAERVEGAGRSRNIVREFPSYAEALACYRSPEYTRARPLRAGNALVDFLVAEGYDGDQPAPVSTPPAAADRKGYWIVHADVGEAAGYEVYARAVRTPLGAFGGRFLVRGGAREPMEGAVRGRTELVEFPSYEAAHACYRSPGHQAAAALRRGAAEVDLCIVEQYDGPQMP
jgi:uncharacterized protein (DUF1330 family)